MKLTPLERTLELRADAYDAKKRTVRLSVSSEKPVDRWFGSEILDHEPNSVRLQRFNDGANVLFNHRMDDVIGVIEKAWIEDKRLLAEIRIAKTTRGDEVAGLIEDGILRNVSVGYRIHEILEKPKTQEYRAVDWEPYELSIVTVPADPSVGIGRAHAGDEADVKVRSAEVVSPPKGKSQRSAAMADQATQDAPAGAAADVQVIDNETGAKLERARVSALIRLGEDNKIESPTVRKWIDGGMTVNSAGDEVVRIMEARSKDVAKSPAALGLSRRELEGYSFMRAVRAVADKNWNGAGLELEAHQTIAKRLNTTPDPNKFYVPLDIQSRNVDPAVATQQLLERLGAGPLAKRDLTVASAGAGGYLVGTDNQGFIELLRNISVCFRMGARRLSGLVGNVTVPRQSVAGTAYWLSSESTQITESTQTLVQLALSPKNVGAYTEISRQLTLQSSPDAESMVMADLAAVVAIAVDLAGIEGSGASGQPTGISQTSGVGSVTGTSIDFAKMLEFQTDVAAGNVNPMRGGYVTTPAVAALLMQRVKYTSTASPLWDGNVWAGNACGFPGLSSNQPTAASMIFGDWEKLVIGEWGVLEVEVNPYANFQAGIIGVRAMYSVDVGVRYPIAFSRATSIT
jgi:HK97 family phage major capsid protein/HK97 family phage prohead protease